VCKKQVEQIRTKGRKKMYYFTAKLYFSLSLALFLKAILFLGKQFVPWYLYVGYIHLPLSRERASGRERESKLLFQTFDCRKRKEKY
jgi:hypothetical protein